MRKIIHKLIMLSFLTWNIEISLTDVKLSKEVSVQTTQAFYYWSSHWKSSSLFLLILKAPNMTAADDIHKYFFIVFQRK